MIKAVKVKKEDCCGCQACADICHANAIHMWLDEEGFWYPKVDAAACMECGLCEKVCPLRDAGRNDEEALYLGVQARDDAIRQVSSSGGMFPLLAHAVLKEQGLIYGAGYGSGMKVMHQRAETMEQLEALKGTKYVQSSMKGVYQDIQTELRHGRNVLFCGTPCQSQALRQFLNGEDDGLILVDLVCYGAGSPGIWRDYVAYLERRYAGKLESFSFRDKRNRDNGHVRAFATGGREIVDSLYRDIYCKMYFGNYSLRPACHQCGFCGPQRSSDFTIGDFWGIENVRPDFDDGLGTSMVIAHTEKARALWRKIEKDARWFVCGREAVLQPRLQEPTKAAKYRRLFMALYRRLPFHLLAWLVNRGR